MLAVERRLVDLEVARVYDHPGWRVHGNRDAVGHAVRHPDELDAERPDLYALTRVEDLARRRLQQAVFLELRFDERKRERRRDDRTAEQRHDMGDGADVILDVMGAEYLERNLDVLAVNGRIVIIGLMGGVKSEINLGMLLARTDPDAPKHAGITYFRFEMDQPGVTVRPLREMTGRALFNEVFIEGAHGTLEVRDTYLLPLHHLQVELVRRYRAGHTDERVRTGIHISINGIAAALRNTG